VKAINQQAKEIFYKIITDSAFEIGSLEKSAEKRLNLLKNFYDEKNIIGIVTVAYSNEEDQNRYLLEKLLNEDIPSIIEGIKESVKNIDKLLKSCIEKGGRDLELF